MTWNKKEGERRKEPRYEICSDVTVMTSNATIIAAAKNISGGGMEIQLQKCINPATNLTILLRVHEEFTFQGTVVWTLGDYINKQWIYRVGIKTMSISHKNGTVTTSQEKRELVKTILPYISTVKVDERIRSKKAA